MTKDDFVYSLQNIGYSENCK